MSDESKFVKDKGGDNHKNKVNWKLGYDLTTPESREKFLKELNKPYDENETHTGDSFYR